MPDEKAEEGALSDPAEVTPSSQTDRLDALEKAVEMIGRGFERVNQRLAALEKAAQTPAPKNEP